MSICNPENLNAVMLALQSKKLTYDTFNELILNETQVCHDCIVVTCSSSYNGITPKCKATCFKE
jgi:hypothetical protein